MPKIKYQDKNFNDDKLLAIQRANRICESYAAQGYDLTLRQLYYRFVANGWLPNTVKSYNWLGDLISDARLAGYIDWNHIIDRTRNLRHLRHFNDPSHAVKWLTEQYQIDMWERQPHYVEVWVEKDALAGVIGQAANAQDCPYFSCRGYTSQSEVWGAAQRIGNMLRKGKQVTILHLGDHDPSGIDMTRDIRERLEMFIRRDNVNTLADAAWRAAEKLGHGAARNLNDLPEPARTRIFDLMRKAEDSWGNLTIDRIALNMDQVEQYEPPPNPAKVTDSRFKGYQERFGDDSWELDALEPATLDALIQSEIEAHKSRTLWDEDEARMERQRMLLQAVSDHWSQVEEYVDDRGWVE